MKSAAVGQAETHEAGAAVYAIQTLVHDPVGALAFRWGPYWPYHARIAERAYEQLLALHAKLAQIDPGTSNIRLVSDEDAEAFYDHGTTMVSNVVRTIRHLAHTMASERHATLVLGRAIDEIRQGTEATGIDCRINHPGYHGLGEIVRVRDAIEHPVNANIYQGNDVDWDQVPLAWILSDRSAKAYAAYREWLAAILVDWHAWRSSQPKTPTTFTGVQRGMGSRYPSKKPT
jgi:hypothetical protein